MTPTVPNADQINAWNTTSGSTWVALQERLDAQLERAGLDALDRLDVRVGERALDVGCGCGGSSLELARRVGSAGSVLGVDVSADMLARARERAVAAGLAHVTFVEADAQTYALEAASVDVVFSRFGVMFFDDPVAAFANLRRALRPGGRMAFICWQSMDRNPIMLMPGVAAAEHVEMPPRPPPGTPGPFAFADPDHVRRILASAGFSGVEVTPVDTSMIVGGTTDLTEAVDLSMRLGPTAAVLRQCPADVVPRVREAIRRAFTPHHGAEGVRLGAALWCVSAR